MTKETVASIGRHFGELDDPRDDRRVDHKLIDVWVIAIYAVISRAEGWPEVASFGRVKQIWFESFLELPHTAYDYDTDRKTDKDHGRIEIRQ